MSASPIIILTGASRGLGLSILQILLRNNARVTTLSRSYPEDLKSLEKEFKDHLLVVQGDVGTIEDNAKAVASTVEKWGGIDSLIVNAGSIEPTRIANINLSKAPEYLSVNMLSVLYLVQPALPYLRKSNGRVVLVSSGASSRGYTSWGLYSAVKAAMNSFARTLANEEKDLSVWSIRPGVVDTSMQELLRSMPEGVMDPEERSKFTSLHEKGQLLDPKLPGGVIAGLGIDGPKDLSGEYLEWSDDRLARFKLE